MARDAAGTRQGSWLCELEGYPAVSTDDLTLDEVQIAERACGTPYTLMDPHVSVRIDKALLAILMVKAGMPEDQALRKAGKLTLSKLHGAFTYVPATAPAPAAVEDDEPAGPPSSAPTSEPG